MGQWKYVDAERLVAGRINADGSHESRLVSSIDPAETVLPEDAPGADQIVLDLTNALEDHYDAVARSRRYDSRYTCALRAGYVSYFQPEGLAFAQWMDGCNAQSYQIMIEVQAGQRPIPTAVELIALMDQMVWPA